MSRFFTTDPHTEQRQHHREVTRYSRSHPKWFLHSRCWRQFSSLTPSSPRTFTRSSLIRWRTLQRIVVCLEKRRKSCEQLVPVPSSSGRLDMVYGMERFNDRRFPKRYEEAVSVPLATADTTHSIHNAADAGLQPLFSPSIRKEGRIGCAIEETWLFCVWRESTISIPKGFQRIGCTGKMDGLAVATRQGCVVYCNTV